MNTQANETILECRSAVAGDRSRFIDANDIGRWFAKMIKADIRDFMRLFRQKDTLMTDFRDDWEETLEKYCEPSKKDLQSLRHFWKRSDKTDLYERDKWGYHHNYMSPSEKRKKWFSLADSGEIYRTGRLNAEPTEEEWEIYTGLVREDRAYICQFVGERNVSVRYFVRMAETLSHIRHISYTHYGWFRRRGCYLTPFANYGDGDLVADFAKENGLSGISFKKRYTDKIRYVKSWENMLFKKREAIKITEFALKALWNPHTELGKKHAEKLYNDNFADE